MLNALLQRLAMLTLVSAVTGCELAGGSEESKPSLTLTNELVERVESSLVLPSGAYRLSSYARYYSPNPENSDEILGTYVHGRGSAGSFIVAPDRMPQLQDGGCSVIELRYSLKDRKATALFCHGEA